jgi:hypothetical protein
MCVQFDTQVQQCLRWLRASSQRLLRLVHTLTLNLCIQPKNRLVLLSEPEP